MSKDLGASPDGDRAAGLRPEPAAQSQRSSIPSASSYVRHCYFQPRPTDETLFAFEEDGRAVVRLDGYAIIPMERYHQLSGASRFPPDNPWPCRRCGAESPTAEGHDPCIANLPGVVHACCGHGYGHAYVKFQNGTVMRGHFLGE